jgi:hypothetical protein
MTGIQVRLASGRGLPPPLCYLSVSRGIIIRIRPCVPSSLGLLALLLFSFAICKKRFRWVHMAETVRNVEEAV